MKKGFTLIELLAVIIILAIIAVITVPIVLNIVIKTRQASAEDHAIVIADIASQYQVKQQMIGNDIKNIDLTTDILEYDGEKPEKGIIHFNDERKVYLKMYYNGYCITREYNGTVSSEKTDFEDCEINTDLVNSSN